MSVQPQEERLSTEEESSNRQTWRAPSLKHSESDDGQKRPKKSYSMEGKPLMGANALRLNASIDVRSPEKQPNKKDGTVNLPNTSFFTNRNSLQWDKIKQRVQEITNPKKPQTVMTYGENQMLSEREARLIKYQAESAFGKKFFQVCIPLDENKPLNHRSLDHTTYRTSTLHYPLSATLVQVMQHICDKSNLKNGPEYYQFFFPGNSDMPISRDFTIRETLIMQAMMDEAASLPASEGADTSSVYDQLVLVVEPVVEEVKEEEEGELPPSGRSTTAEYPTNYIESYKVENASANMKRGRTFRPQFKLLEGEIIEKKIKAVSFLQKTVNSNLVYPHGALFLTNFRMVFQSRVVTSSIFPSPFAQDNSSAPVPGGVFSMSQSVDVKNGEGKSMDASAKTNEGREKMKRSNSILQNEDIQVHIPWMTISYKHRKSLSGQLSGQDQIKIQCYDMRSHRITIPTARSEELWDKLTSIDRAPLETKLFAFQYRWQLPQEFQPSWTLFSLTEEYRRMNLPGDGWMVVDWNEDFKMIPTYPQYLALPRAMSASDISFAVGFRSKGRIPTLTWKNPNGLQTISRSSQPFVGIMGKTSQEDEKLMREILNTNNPDGRATLRILDARPKFNAVGNKAMGLGYEYNTNSIKISFMGIENIHVMRDSWFKVFELVNRSKLDDNGWCSGLEATGWMKHTKAILEAAKEALVYIQSGESILVHCSDGWDRTAQICSLAQLLLDPFYRTIEGFIRLIHKDWLSFGHKFGERCGQENKEMERSPTFFQFLDCVFQLTHQFPNSFQFNETFLITLADELYTCRFGTFLYNCERQRMENKLKASTVSIWSWMETRKDNYLNRHYCKDHGYLSPQTLIRRLVFWDGFFLRYDHIDGSSRIPLGFEYYGDKPSIDKAIITNFQKMTRTVTRVMVNPETVRASTQSFPDVIRLLSEEKILKKKAVRAEAESIINDIIESVFAHESSRSTEGTSERELIESGSILITHKPSWIPDQWVTHCALCTKPFTRVRRRHHCRHCGNVFCHQCSNHMTIIPKFMYYQPVRVCNNCHDELGRPCMTKLP